MKIFLFLHNVSIIHQHKEDILIIYLVLISDTILCKSTTTEKEKKHFSKTSQFVGLLLVNIQNVSYHTVSL